MYNFHTKKIQWHKSVKFLEHVPQKKLLQNSYIVPISMLPSYNNNKINKDNEDQDLGPRRTSLILAIEYLRSKIQSIKANIKDLPKTINLLRLWEILINQWKIPNPLSALVIPVRRQTFFVIQIFGVQLPQPFYLTISLQLQNKKRKYHRQQMNSLASALKQLSRKMNINLPMK